MTNEKNSLHRDSLGVIAKAKGYCLLDAGFFYIMRNQTIENETADSFLDGEFVTTILGTKNYRFLEKAAVRKGVDIETYAQAAILRSVASDIGLAFEGEMLVPVDSKTFLRLKRAAKFEEVRFATYLRECFQLNLEHSEEHMETDSQGAVVGGYPWDKIAPATPLKNPLPPLPA